MEAPISRDEPTLATPAPSATFRDHGVIFLPTRSGSQIELRLEDLNDCSTNDILTLLKEEGIPLSFWVTIGRALMQLPDSENRVHDLVQEGAEEALTPTLGDYSKRERMDIINMVATLYLTKFSKGNPKDDFDKKLEYLTTARSYFQKAEDQHLLVTSAAWIGRGSLDVAWFLLNKRADVTYLDCAFQYFETARELAKDATTPHEIQHAHIGLGLVCYLKKDWKNAAVQYQNVFRFGSGPPNILFSLALCHHKLGEDEKAQNIVLRILEQQPDHLGSLCAMAKGIVSPTPELSKRLGIPEATPDDKDPKLKWLTKAVEAHPGEPLASVLLCDDLISTSGSNSDMWDILTAALPRCMDRNLQSEIHYQLGRMCHEEGKIREAERHLRKCIDIFNGKHYSAMYTLAQVLGREGEIAEATTMLEDIREAHPNDYDVMKLLSVLYVEKEEYEQALECVNKCVLLQRDRGDDDINLWVLQARCLVAQLTKGDMYAEAAIKAYERLLEYVGQKPAESEQVDQCIIWNNIGTLKFKKKDLDGARHAYEKALEILDGRGNEADTTHLRATLVFNLACVHEEKSEFQNAADRYHSLLLQYPWFTEPKSRLGSLELRQRNPVQALTHLEASQSTSLTNVLLTSEAYRQQGQYEKARSVVAQALKERDTENSYKTVATTEALVYLGTLHYEMALLLCPYRRAPQRDQHFQRAFQLFTKAYEGHPEGQPLAANGMAMVFAQKKEFNKAHRLFSKVLQMNESPHVRMNLGHTYMRGGATKVNPGAAPNPLDARKALRLYEAAWNKNVFSDDAEKTHIATSMALAHFVAKDFAKGIEVLERAKEANPGNQQIIYNLAISKHGQASKIMKNTEERAKPEKVKGAVELLKEAKIGFESVIDSFLQCKQSGSVPLGFEDLQKLEMKKVVGICRARQTHCGDSIDGCTEWLQRQADSVTQMAARQRREREKQLQLMREEEESIEAEKRKEQEEAEKKRREAEELAESLMEVALGMQLPRETDKEPERGEKKKKDDKSDGEEQEEGEEEGGEEAPKVDLTEEEKEERQRRKDEKRLAKMTEEERAAYIEQKEAKRKKRAEKEAKRQAEKKKKADAAEGVEGAGGDEGANGADAGEGVAAEGPAEDGGEVEKKKKKSKKDKKDKNKDKAEKKNKKRKLEKRAANDGGAESGPATEAGAEGAGLDQGDAAEDGEQAAKKARTEPVMAKEEVVDESKEDVLDDLFPDENDEEDDLFAETLGAADAMELEPTQPINAEPSGFESTQPVGGYPSEFVPTQPMEVPTQPMEVPTQPMEVPTQPMEVPTQPMEAPTQPMGDVLMGFESTQPTGDASSEFVPTLPMSDDPMGFEPTQPTGDDPTEFVPTQPMEPSE